MDFGCGTGEIAHRSHFLGRMGCTHWDVNHGLLDLTRRRAELDGLADRVTMVFGKIGEVEPRPVDVIVVNKVLHHCFPLETRSRVVAVA